MKHIVSKTYELELPSIPSFISAQEEGSPKFSIADLSDDLLKEIGRRWTDALLTAAKNKRVHASIESGKKER